VAALVTEEPVSAQTVSQLTRDLDRAWWRSIRPRWGTTGAICVWTA
jgi:hypothetical protein